MHSFFAETMIAHGERELNRRARRASLFAEAQRQRPARREEPVTLRLARPQDEEALRGLAQLEGRPVPEGPCILAEVDGAVLAALPLESGEFFGDPFRPTSHLVPLLELRAKQLSGGPLRRYPAALIGAIRAWSRA